MNTPTEPIKRRNNDKLPEVLFVPAGDNAEAQRLSRLKRAGVVRQLYRGVYTSNSRATDADVVHRNWSTILGYLHKGAVLSHRSAFDAQPHEGVIYFSKAQGSKKLKLPGLVAHGTIKDSRGPVTNTTRPGARDVAYKGIYVASPARTYLENLTSDKRLLARQLPREELEQRLERILAVKGEFGLNELRDDAREVSKITGMESEFKILDSLIGALLGTHSASKLTAAQALARVQGRPYDLERVQLFEKLSHTLRQFPFANVREPARTGDARTLFAFAESYFSNYIEGTTFTVEEAEDIIFRGKIIPLRTDDSHDVKGTFEAALLDPFYSQPPEDAEGLLTWLKAANAKVLSSRHDKKPGEWKELANQAGNTLFVVPALVEGTLREAWPLMDLLTHPMQRALLGMFIVAEIHPFNDGNGRTARLLMNSYLSANAHCRIIVPTVFREDYLLSLKALTHQADGTSFIRAMRLCQAWTAELDFEHGLQQLDSQLAQSNAKKEDVTQNRLLSPLTGQPMRVPA